MAGSYEMALHDRRYDTRLIENMGDAREALEECIDLIAYLSERQGEIVEDAQKALAKARAVPTWEEREPERYRERPPDELGVGLDHMRMVWMGDAVKRALESDPPLVARACERLTELGEFPKPPRG